ncbi:hypothetical protein L2K70_14610 [Nocardioides KLBMP 9356]|uniref:WD40 repeat domain-containing protein n=1 Tax=Nocardioides potassii TaxID=2911371 RepID=A0ABS9HF46_9ACTN|nr:hypothetical protein [Nocardioides potassii]MCF6378844.1 hypothetical protein [Nocardioides potassii]
MRLPSMTIVRTAVLAAATLALGSALAASPAPSSYAGTETPTTRAAARTLLDVSDLDKGAPPSIAWSERRSGRTVIHGTDGSTTPVSNRLGQFAPMGSGYVVQTRAGRLTRWVGADGTPGRGEWRTGYGLAVSPQGQVVAFAGRAGRVWTIDQAGDRVFRFNRVPVTGPARAVAVTGENCQEGEGDPGFGCSIAVNGPRRAFYTSSHGIVDTVPHLRQTTTGRGRWLGGITSVSDFGTCSAMMRDWRVRWRTCDNVLSDISTDNRHVLGTPAYADGFGPQVLDILSTADGTVVRTFAASRDGSTATYFDEVWEDAAHVLVVTYQDGEWAVVRLGVDGSMEYAVAPRRGSIDTRSPFHLQTR